MPRNARLDAPGALHHIMARGIRQKNIFHTDADRKDFLDRLGRVLRETHTPCFAWSLIPDHIHLALKTADIPLTTVMRRILTGYAVKFNHRHQRKGPLFQNRFKSVLCQEETYLLELVRTVHLQPLRAGLVKDLGELDVYAYSGHSVLMANGSNDWQDTARILALFRTNGHSTRRVYRAFIKKGAGVTPPPELTGGGMIRSAGGWSRVKALRRENAVQSSDERILGDGAFVERMLASAHAAARGGSASAPRGMSVEHIAARVAELCAVTNAEIWAQGKQRRRVEARSILCFWAVRELGLDMSSLARRLGLSVPAVSKSVQRGGRLVHKKGFSLVRP